MGTGSRFHHQGIGSSLRFGSRTNRRTDRFCTAIGYVFDRNGIRGLVNSNEWHLDSQLQPEGGRRFSILYVPSARECPLLLQLPSGEISTTNGFISPCCCLEPLSLF
ncbi:hypothetical protein OROMI_005136 [Orobanche minor]